MVKLTRLIDAVEKLVWRQGVVTGKVTHSVDADGAHIITIRVPEILIDPDSVPTKPSRGGKVPIGPSTPDISRGSKR